MTEPTLLVVFLAALATGLGALPLLLARRAGPRWRAAGDALAAGLMAAASFGLIAEGFGFGPGRTLIGTVAG